MFYDFSFISEFHVLQRSFSTRDIETVHYKDNYIPKFKRNIFSFLAEIYLELTYEYKLNKNISAFISSF